MMSVASTVTAWPLMRKVSAGGGGEEEGGGGGSTVGTPLMKRVPEGPRLMGVPERVMAGSPGWRVVPPKVKPVGEAVTV